MERQVRRATAAAVVAGLLVVGCTSGGAGTPAASVASSQAASPAATPSAAPSPTPAPTATPGPWQSGMACPTSPLNVQQLKAAGRVCFGGKQISVVGYLSPAWGIGGRDNGILPSWLGEEMNAYPVLWQKPRPTAGCVADDDCTWSFLHVKPGSGVTLAAPERWVIITGHFQDALSSTCAWDGQTGDPVTPTAAIAACNGHFVVTAVSDWGG